MFNIFLFAVAASTFLNANVHCQALQQRGNDRHKYSREPTGYIIPDDGLEGGLVEQQESYIEDKQLLQQYKAARRNERIPSAQSYQFSATENNPQTAYYHQQQQPARQHSAQIQEQPYPYQLPQLPQPQRVAAPAPADYEQILKNNQLTRLRLAAATAARKAPSVEQYLKEVSPTTKTVYQRPSNYLQFNVNQQGARALPASIVQQQQQQQIENSQPKQEQFQYRLQPEPQQEKSSFSNYQYETIQEQQPKPAPQKPHFNLVAYQNALLAQQKLLQATENQEETASKSSIYVAQTIPKKPTKITKTKPLHQQQIIRQNVQPQQQIDYQAQLELQQQKLLQLQQSSPLYAQQQQLLQQQQSTHQQEQQPTHQQQVKYHTIPQQDRIPTSAPVAYQRDEINYQTGEDYQESQTYRQPKQKVFPQKTRPVKYYTGNNEQFEEQTYEYQTTPVYKYQNDEQELTYQPKPLPKRPLPLTNKPYEPKIKYQIDNNHQSQVKYQQQQQATADESVLQYQTTRHNPQIPKRHHQQQPQEYQQHQTPILRRPALNPHYQSEAPVRQSYVSAASEDQFSDYRQTNSPYQQEASEVYRTIDPIVYRSQSSYHHRNYERPSSSYSVVE